MRIHKYVRGNNVFTTYKKPGTMLDMKNVNVIKITLVTEGLHTTGGYWGWDWGELEKERNYHIWEVL